MVTLPAGFQCGQSTDTSGWTGVTVLLAPPGSVCAGEVRGGGPGTRESDLLSVMTSTPGPSAMVFAGGSAGGLAAADGVYDWLRAAGRGFDTPAGPVPLVSAAVVFDLLVGAPDARPTAADGWAACEAAGSVVERGSVGAGTGCSAGQLGAPTKTGLGAARLGAAGVTVVAVAVVNPLGDVLDADGTVLAGARAEEPDGRLDPPAGATASGAQADPTSGAQADPTASPPSGRTPSVALLLGGATAPLHTNTTLVAVLTDARLTKLEAALCGRAATAGVARAVSPVATAYDGDLSCCFASGVVAADPEVVSVLAAEAAADAVRDGARSATSAPGCPAAADADAQREGGG